MNINNGNSLTFYARKKYSKYNNKFTMYYNNKSFPPRDETTLSQPFDKKKMKCFV
jgi:hypothetical protein